MISDKRMLGMIWRLTVVAKYMLEGKLDKLEQQSFICHFENDLSILEEEMRNLDK